MLALKSSLFCFACRVVECLSGRLQGDGRLISTSEQISSLVPPLWRWLCVSICWAHKLPICCCGSQTELHTNTCVTLKFCVYQAVISVQSRGCAHSIYVTLDTDNQVTHSVELARGWLSQLAQGQVVFQQRMIRSQIDGWKFNPTLVAGGIRGNVYGRKQQCSHNRLDVLTCECMEGTCQLRMNDFYIHTHICL